MLQVSHAIPGGKSAHSGALLSGKFRQKPFATVQHMRLHSSLTRITRCLVPAAVIPARSRHPSSHQLPGGAGVQSCWALKSLYCSTVLPRHHKEWLLSGRAALHNLHSIALSMPQEGEPSYSELLRQGATNGEAVADLKCPASFSL